MVRWRVAEGVSRVRWIFLPLGLCALVAVGAHAAADVVGDKVLWCVDRVDAFFDALFSSWSVTAPLVDLVGLGQRTFLARAVALVWELCADALIAVPLLGYEERSAEREVELGRAILRKKPTPRRLARPIAALLVSVAGACAVARMVQGAVELGLHTPWLSHLCAVGALLMLLALFVPRAALRSLEHADQKGSAVAVGVFGTALLVPLMLAALAASPLLSFFR
jgi:hypothetical protein